MWKEPSKCFLGIVTVLNIIINVVLGIIFLNRHFLATRKYVPFSTCSRVRTKHGKQSHCFNREHYIVNVLNKC